MLIHIIADYGIGDLAFAEVVQRIKLHLPDAETVSVPVPPFSTLAVGFCIAQLGLNVAPPGTLIGVWSLGVSVADSAESQNSGVAPGRATGGSRGPTLELWIEKKTLMLRKLMHNAGSVPGEELRQDIRVNWPVKKSIFRVPKK